MSGLRVAIIADARHPVAEPFAGGLEAHVWHFTLALQRRGHQVTLFAGAGSDRLVPSRVLEPANLHLSPAAVRDVSMPSEQSIWEHHAYLSLMLELSRTGARDFDIVHNHSLHYLPVAMVAALSVPVLTTLHTPPTPWLESALRLQQDQPVSCVAVSAATASAWRPIAPDVAVILNGIDCSRWPVGPGGRDVIWFGRLTPEKGAHLAIDAARTAGRRIRIAGPISDSDYFEKEIVPRLGGSVRYLGHLNQRALAHEVGRSRVTLVTPRWDEPYGLVAAESLACGTPVAAFARGGIPEILDRTSGCLAEPDNVTDLSRAMDEAARLPRTGPVTSARERCDIDVMVARYESAYAGLIQARA